MEMEIRQGCFPILQIRVHPLQAAVHLLVAAHLPVEAAQLLYVPFHVAVVDCSWSRINTKYSDVANFCNSFLVT